jgi:hypothetical protein
MKEWRATRSRRAKGVGETLRTERVIRRIEVAPGAMGEWVAGLGG